MLTPFWFSAHDVKCIVSQHTVYIPLFFVKIYFLIEFITSGVVKFGGEPIIIALTVLFLSFVGLCWYHKMSYHTNEM